MAQLDIVITNSGNAEKITEENKNKPGNSGTGATRDSSVKQTAKSVYAQRMISLAANTAKTLGKFVASQYGDMTGNYIGQRKIDNAVATAEGLISLGSSVAMGTMAGGWIGALVAVGTYTVNMGVNQIQSSVNYSKEISKTNAIANYNSNRIGAILIDGNRG